MLLCHSAAVKYTGTNIKLPKREEIGITIVTHWWKPKFQTLASREAALRSLDFMFGWFANPIVHGDYPKVMRSLVGYYTEDAPASSNAVNHSWTTDRLVTASTTNKNGTLIGAATDLDWLFVYPKGIRETLLYIKEKYNNPYIYITENGYAYGYNASVPIQEARKDSARIRYHHDHLWYLLKAIKDGVKVKGYYAWSFWDDFEWDAGYTMFLLH
ncbi:hypothetical protein M0R45_033966 [Rubus argutus]|uniref:Uncharacterized protein n=1 Tax=Rubus argutus TaxID=59490 RepID=A0AAW1VNW2_RUBAR